MEKITSIDIIEIFKSIHRVMCENKEYLIELDSKAGDGDLGISMCQGFGGIVDDLSKIDVKSLEPKKILIKAAMSLNEYSPSSLGTILSIAIMSGAKTISDDDIEASLSFIKFVQGGYDGICARAGSKRGEKTILDSIAGALDKLSEYTEGLSIKKTTKMAADGAYEGMEKTIGMKAVHGRAAYYGEKSIGFVDGGATVGMLIFKVISEYFNPQA